MLQNWESKRGFLISYSITLATNQIVKSMIIIVNNLGPILFLEECKSQMEIRYETNNPITGARIMKAAMTATPEGIPPSLPGTYQFTILYQCDTWVPVSSMML